MLTDLITIARWWLMLLFWGAVSFPLLARFSPLRPRGWNWLFAKIVTTLVVSYLVFLAASLHWLPFGLTSISLFLLGLFILNVLAWRRRPLRLTVKDWQLMAVTETVFLVSLFLWALVRGFQPDIQGLEKFMDFGFLNSILRSRWLPAADPWFAGQPINYYYFGHLQAAVLTLFSGLPARITYNLLIATIFALTFSGSFSLAGIWLTARRRLSKKAFWRAVITGGLIGAFLLSLGGNLHAAVFVIKDGARNYWYPNATRFIGYYPPNSQDRTIHEFPGYSFVVADLHAHLIDLLPVLLFLFFLSQFLIFSRRKFGWRSLTLGFVLGVMLMANAWDFPIYGGLFALATWLQFGRRHFWRWLKFGLVVFLTALTIASPFLFHFHSIAQGLALTPTHSLWWQLLVLWGFFWLLSLLYWFGYRRLIRRTSADRFVLAITFWATILVFLPEIAYVKDIYTVGYHRANTMFKLVYQSFVLYALAAGYISWRLLEKSSRWRRGILAILISLGFAAQMIYPVFAIDGYYGRINASRYRGLDGLAFMAKKMPADYQLRQWLVSHIKGQPVVLEAAGESYTLDDRISATTGLPTVEGWLVHEWLWRGGYQLPQQRQHEVELIYQGKDMPVAHYLILKYKVRYVVVGKREREKYPNLDEKRFQGWGKLVFKAGQTHLYLLDNL